MHKLNLDFHRKPSLSVSGMVLLTIALLLGGQLFLDTRDIKTEVELGESTLSRLERLTGHKAPSTSKKEGDPYGAEIKRANEVINQLAQPWDQLFAAVEGATGKDVALLAINPEKRKGSVSISGEAKNIAAMLDYLRRLNETPSLSDVVLQSHQIQQNDPQKPIHFNLSAKWVTE